METQLLSELLAMVICIVFSAYFSASETAFSSLNRARMKAMAEQGDKRAERALALAEQYDRLLSTLLIGNNIVNIAVASIGTVMFVRYYGDMGATISTVVITIVAVSYTHLDVYKRQASGAAPIKPSRDRPAATEARKVPWPVSSFCGTTLKGLSLIHI